MYAPQVKQTMPSLHIHPTIAELETTMIELRRQFHQHPELGFQEIETAQTILGKLKGLNLEVRQPVAQTGIVAVLRNGNGPCIALRADMDALPIQETGKLPHKSVQDGVMHACGHDGHMAILLGTLLALESHRDLWRGTVKFIFQPAEEGFAGARHMVEAGVLKEPKVTAIFGLHLWNYQRFGTVGVMAGPVTAAADKFTITVKGTGGHGAMPQGTVDAIVVATQLVANLQTIVSRNLNPLDAGLVTIGQIHGGTNFNILADEVTLTGTVRAYRDSVRHLIKERLQALCDGTAASHQTTITLDYQDGYPPTVNDAAMTEVVAQAASQVVGEGVGEPFRSMVGEDMSYYLQKVPGCFFFLGSAKPEHKLPVPHHSAHFDFDERALAVGASVFVGIIQALLPAGK